MMTLLGKMKNTYENNVYRYNYRNGDYLTVTDSVTGEQFEAPVANLLLALQYSAAAINYSGIVIIEYPCDFYWDDYIPVEITFEKGSPIKLVGNTNRWIYGQTELLRRIKK